MSKTKKTNYYYITKSELNELQYACLFDNSTEIVIMSALNYKCQRNYRMNHNYKATDEELFRYRTELNLYNDEIRQTYFKNSDKTTFKIDVLNYNSINDTVYNNVIINSDQKIINKIPDINFKEFHMFENCLSCGLISVNKSILEKPSDTYSYDYAKYYYYMMNKIRIPIVAPSFQTITTIDFNNLQFGFYRVHVASSNVDLWNSFQFNSNNFYSHNTLKTLYKYKDKYTIKFSLLPCDEEFDYNVVLYSETIELRKLFSGWFKCMNILLKTCSKSNWLLKSYISQAWGTICKYNKTFVFIDDSPNFDWDQLNKITNDQYEYYNYKLTNNTYTLIDSNKPFAHKGLARIKLFLTEYSRTYMFNMINECNLEKHVMRIQTDSVSFNIPVDFTKFDLKYYPIPETKSTGHIVFYNVNSYFHHCPKCKLEYKYNKSIVHECIEIS